jgi:hypothetical protein
VNVIGVQSARFLVEHSEKPAGMMPITVCGPSVDAKLAADAPSHRAELGFHRRIADHDDELSLPMSPSRSLNVRPRSGLTPVTRKNDGVTRPPLTLTAVPALIDASIRRLDERLLAEHRDGASDRSK